MRGHLIALVSVTFALASACGGSSGGTTTTTSGTTGAASTTGSTSSGTGTTGTTTGTSTGTTTGTTGTTTGGGLAAGAPCTSNASCQSAICGINGSGNCCSAACSTSDATCGATACDNTGACTYPAVSCGTDSCASGMLTSSACNGGTCAAGTPTACPNNLECNGGGTACLTQCATASDCASGFYCDTGTNQCAAQQATGACTANAACTSGFCGTNGMGNCCTAQCMAATDPACDPTDCDGTSGACVYPTGTTCGTVTCTGSTLSAGACDATGACNAGTSPCPNSLNCNTGGTACLTMCTMDTDCVSGFYCNGGACAAVMATGACTSNSACTSGICGVNGTGHCCTAACSTADMTCGATDCDGVSGACSYPQNTTSCGAAGTCSNGTETTAMTCDGAGNCSASTMVDCTPYICGTNACLTTCTDTTSCIAGAFCETDYSVCCGLSAGGTVAVDSVTGNDATGCCGVGTNKPCQTLTRAMALIGEAQATGVTINATVNGVGGNWAPSAGEVYPVVLGWGVELSAPGVFFLDANQIANTAIFDIAVLGAGPTDYASIVGTAANPVSVGFDPAGNQTDSTSTISVETGNTLYVANASVNGSYSVIIGGMPQFDSYQAFFVNSGASLVLGQDQAALVTGTVTIGNALGQHATDGFQGIVCGTDGVSLGCTVTDAALGGQSSVVIEGQEGLDIDAEDFASITLTSNPVIGIPPVAIGFTNAANGTGCGSKLNDVMVAVDPLAVKLNGAVTMTFNNGMVQCIGGPGFQLLSTTNGSPALSIDSTTIQNADLGIDAQAGTATVTNTTLNYNYIGVQQDNDPNQNTTNGTIDLTGGGNTVVCSSNVESSSGNTNPGIDVYNTSGANLAADNVAWDTTQPDYFSCDNAFASCACNTTCATTPGGDDMDAVEDSTNLGGITTTGNTQAATFCN